MQPFHKALCVRAHMCEREVMWAGGHGDAHYIHMKLFYLF
jgi:hypothetical protein